MKRKTIVSGPIHGPVKEQDADRGPALNHAGLKNTKTAPLGKVPRRATR